MVGSSTFMGGRGELKLTTIGAAAILESKVFCGMSVAGGESESKEFNDCVCLVRTSVADGLFVVGGGATGVVSFNRFGSLTVTTRNRELGKKVGELPVDVGDRDGNDVAPGEAGSLTLTTRKRLLLRDGLGTGDDIGLGTGLGRGERSGVEVVFFSKGSSSCWA